MRERPAKISYMFELAEQCNQRCVFCYNAWRPSGAPAKRALRTDEVLRVLRRVIEETPCHSIALSGGEPLLRRDLFEVISFIKSRNVKVGLISNGFFLSAEAIARCLTSGVDVFQISLLGDGPEIHNRLAGVNGFEKAFDAIFEVKKAGGKAHVFFVALADNIDHFRGVLELCVLLGVDQVSFGRFLPGGAGLTDWKTMLPDPVSIDRALAIADEFAGKYRIAISMANPIPPCLHDVSKYPHVRFGFCAAGREDHACFAIDPEGNLKVCSHSPVALGNLLAESFEKVAQSSFLSQFVRTVPEFCIDCTALATCRGGCRSSAQVCYGSPASEDPYLSVWKARARKPARRVAAGSSTTCEEVP